MNSFKTVLISYKDSFELMNNYLNFASTDKDKDLVYCLRLLVLSLFCKSTDSEVYQEVKNLNFHLERVGFVNWETSDIGFLVTSCILRETLEHFPSFKAYLDSYCLNKQDIDFVSHTDFIICLSQEQLFTYVGAPNDRQTKHFSYV
jgi:maltooligosyltrehalose synthase